MCAARPKTDHPAPELERVTRRSRPLRAAVAVGRGKHAPGARRWCGLCVSHRPALTDGCPASHSGAGWSEASATARTSTGTARKNWAAPHPWPVESLRRGQRQKPKPQQKYGVYLFVDTTEDTCKNRVKRLSANNKEFDSCGVTVRDNCSPLVRAL